MQHGLSDLGVASLGDGEVFVAALGEAGIAGPIVGDDRRTRSNGALDKAAERFRAAVWHDSESDTSGVATALPLIELGSRLALSHFNGAGDKKLVVNALALAARAAADPGFVDFDMVAGLAADAVLIRPNHTSAELVEDLKGGFVTGKPDLALELCGSNNPYRPKTNSARSRRSISYGLTQCSPKPMQALGILIFLVEFAGTS